MNREAWLTLIVVLGLTAGTGVYLGTIKGRQRLGPPGVKVVNEPVYGESVKADGTKETFLAGSQSVYLPPHVLNYGSAAVPVAKVAWDWLPKDTTYGQRLYNAPDGFTVSTTVVLMGHDRTSIHEPEHCLVGGGWNITGREATRISMRQPVPYDLPVTALTVIREEKDEHGQAVTTRGIFLYWFVSENELTADHLKRMWRLALDMMRTGVLQRWAYVSCFSVCRPGAEGATFERMKEFIAAATPEFQLVPSHPAAAGSPAGGRTARK
jgi:hypothetical protein